MTTWCKSCDRGEHRCTGSCGCERLYCVHTRIVDEVMNLSDEQIKAVMERVLETLAAQKELQQKVQNELQKRV